MPFEQMKNIFNEKAKLQRWLDIEAALAKAEASLGIIPSQAAEEICAKAKIELIDMEYWRQEFKRKIHVIVTTVHSLQKICEGDAGEYIHWGATSQDIVDTADHMAIKAAHHLIFNTLRDIEANLLIVVEREADTVMAGRTHGQHAIPITFGYKVAVWVCEIRRHIERLKESRKRLFVGQLSGGVGNYSAIGEKGPEVERMVMKELGLEAPEICWQASRDRGAEFACLVAMIAGTLGKIANEIYSLQRTEIAEVKEPLPEGRIGSSTMPHKRNPFMCEFCMSLSKRIRYYAPLAIEAMLVEHERGDGGWYIQRDSLSEMCLLMGDLLSRMEKVTADLIICPDTMKKNLGKLKGFILSEAVMFKLGTKIGRQTAHEVIYNSLVNEKNQDLSLKEALIINTQITDYLSEEELNNLLDPVNYTGLSSQIARNIVLITKNEREKDMPHRA